MWVQPSAASHSDNASSSLVVVLKVRTSRLIVPLAMCRTQATTVSPAFARAGSYARRGRRNGDRERPSALLPLCATRRGTPSKELQEPRSRAAAGPWRTPGCSGVPGRTKGRALSHQAKPDLCAGGAGPMLPLTSPPFHRSAGRRSRWETKEALAVPERHAKLLEIDLGQLRQDISVDFIRAEKGLALSEAETSEPTPDIHVRAPRAPNGSSVG